MNVLLINTSDCQGGADRVAVQLLRGLRKRGTHPRLLVHERRTQDPNIVALPPSRDGRRGKQHMVAAAARLQRIPGAWRLGAALYTFAGGPRQKLRQQGREIFDYPESHDLPHHAGMDIDLVHAHNLHGHYFDLRSLETLSQQYPVVITLHDEWLYTGHCVYTLDCERWRDACGECPYLNIPHALEADGTRENRALKHRVAAASRLHLVTPSEWLRQRVEASGLTCASLRCIPNGVDPHLFKPARRRTAREELGLPADGPLVLCVANQRNVFKDFATLEAAVNLLPGQPAVTFVSAGGKTPEERRLGAHRWILRPFEPDPARLARLYQAADLFVLSTRADNYPLVTLEAMSSGLPVIASAVGGIPEQIADDRGILVPPQDAPALSQAIARLVQDPAQRELLGWNARRWVESHANESDMVRRYHALYQEISR